MRPSWCRNACSRYTSCLSTNCFYCHFTKKSSLVCALTHEEKLNKKHFDVVADIQIWLLVKQKFIKGARSLLRFVARYTTIPLFTLNNNASEAWLTSLRVDSQIDKPRLVKCHCDLWVFNVFRFQKRSYDVTYIETTAEATLASLSCENQHIL